MNHKLEDVTNIYAADRVTTLGTMNNQAVTGPRTDVQEIYLLNPQQATAPQLGWVTHNQPRPVQRKVAPRIPNFGSTYSNSNVAKKRGHIMTESNFQKGKR